MSQPLSNLAPDYSFDVSNLPSIRNDIAYITPKYQDIERPSIIPIPRSNIVEPVIIESVIIEPVIVEPTREVTIVEINKDVPDCVKEIECVKKDPCNDPCKDPCQDPCKDPCHDPCNDPCKNNSGWEWLGYFVLWFIVFTVLFWLIYYSLKPPFVLQSDSNQVDTAKVLLAAVISAFILIIIVWLIKAAIGQ